METRPRGFDFDAAELSVAELATRLGTEERPATTVERTWWDTFDHRLWFAGLVLEVDRPAGRRSPRPRLRAVLRDRDTNGVRWVTTVDEVPRCGEDLPAGPWKRSLGGLLGMRALMPIAAVRLATATLTMLDDRRKVVAEALWEQAAGQPSVVRVVPLHGYAPGARRVAKKLAGAGLVRLERHPMEVALGCRPTRAAGDLVRSLDPRMPAVEATRQILAGLWAAMSDVEPWLGDPPDTEFLHDYRVALRRSRSVMKQADGILAPGDLAAWRPRLGALQRSTNRARDLDVFLLEFPAYRAALPSEYAGDLEPLRVLLLELRNDEQRAITSYLVSAEHRMFTESYTRFLSEPFSAEGAKLADAPVGTVAAKRIGRADRRLRAGGEAITPESPSTHLHEVRILAKELRYALELYAPLYEPGALAPLVRELKQLQDNLGEFQDNEVHAAEMHAFGELLQKAGATPARTLMAMGLLAGVFVERQAAARREFTGRFATFTSRGHRERLEALLRSPRGGKRS